MSRRVSLRKMEAYKCKVSGAGTQISSVSDLLRDVCACGSGSSSPIHGSHDRAFTNRRVHRFVSAGLENSEAAILLSSPHVG